MKRVAMSYSLMDTVEFMPRWTAFGGVRGRSELPGYVERYLRGEIKLDEFVTHTMGLEDVNKAFDLMHAGKSIRTVLLFDDK